MKKTKKLQIGRGTKAQREEAGSMDNGQLKIENGGKSKETADSTCSGQAHKTLDELGIKIAPNPDDIAPIERFRGMPQMQMQLDRIERRLDAMETAKPVEDMECFLKRQRHLKCHFYSEDSLDAESAHLSASVAAQAAPKFQFQSSRETKLKFDIMLDMVEQLNKIRLILLEYQKSQSGVSQSPRNPSPGADQSPEQSKGQSSRSNCDRRDKKC